MQNYGFHGLYAKDSTLYVAESFVLVYIDLNFDLILVLVMDCIEFGHSDCEQIPWCHGSF